MKPLFVSSLYHPHQFGGAEKVVRIVAEAMAAQGHAPVVVTTQEQAGHRLAEIGGVKVHYIGLKNVYWPWSRKEQSAPVRALWHGIDSYNAPMAHALGRILDLEQPDVVNTHQLTGFSCAVWNAVKSRRLPLVHTLHDYSLLCPKTTMFRNGNNCSGQCTSCRTYTAPSKRLSQQVDQVVGVSRFTLDRHLNSGYFQSAWPRVIHNGLPGPQLAGEARSPDAGPLRLGYVGQLIPTKGVEQLVREMAGWTAGQCELLVAGAGAASYEAQLRAQAPANVRFLGYVNPDEVYREIDALVVPSLWQDPFPTIVLEAFMHGVPVIASRRGGLPESVEDGRTGLIFDPLDPKGLRQSIEVLLRDRTVLQEMRRHVRERAEYFQLSRMRDEYLHLLADPQDSTGAGASVLRRSHA